MCIAVTAIAYLFMPNGAKEAAASDKAFYTGYILMHYIVPLMVILDYLLFFPKGYTGSAPALLADFALSVYRIYNDLR